MSHRFTFEAAPQRVYWETTNACDLACRHCRAEACPEGDTGELTTEEGRRLLRSLSAFGSPLPHLVFTGGDPLKRPDLFELVDHARSLGFGVSVAPSATPLLDEEAIREMVEHGVDAISLSLDGSSSRPHDAIRGITGTFERTVAAARVARSLDLPFQVNTLVCQETVDDLPAIYARVVELGASRWSLFFLVTVGRGEVLAPVSQERAERVLEWANELSRGRRGPPGPGSPVITTTEAPQIRRVAAEHEHANRPAGGPYGASGRPQHGAGIRDGNGILFISNVGDICPSGFLEEPCGNVRTDDVVHVYRDAPLFRKLRDPAGFGGKCGRCEYKFVCGGSRARAWSATGDPLAEDPLCPHQPAG